MNMFSTARLKVGLIVLFSFIALSAAAKVQAYTVSPSDLNLTAGATADLKVTAKTSDGSNAVSLNLRFTNLEVTNITFPTGLLTIGYCTGNKKFESTSVCVDVASTKPFEADQLLVTISVRKVGNDTASIATNGENKYSKGTVVNGIVAQTGGIPAASAGALSTSSLLVILVVAALTILALGTAAIAYRRMHHKQTSTPPATPLV